MCQRIQDGGRRCPVHRHGTKAFMIAVREKNSELNTLQIERLVSELRREGVVADVNQDSLDRARAELLSLTEGLSERNATKVRNQIGLSEEHDGDMDSATVYALTTLQARAKEREDAMLAAYADVANRTGLTIGEVKAKFWEEYRSVDTPKDAPVPVEYDEGTRAQAAMDNLPYDRASVTAFERIKNMYLPTVGDSRVELTEPKNAVAISRYGYNEGRVELEMKANPGQIYAYRNVTPEEWESIKNHPHPERFLQHQRHAYSSIEAAEADSHAYRCNACGQFRSASSHTCAALDVREELISQGYTPSSADSELESMVTGDGTVDRDAAIAKMRQILVEAPDSEYDSPMNESDIQLYSVADPAEAPIDEHGDRLIKDPLLAAYFGNAVNVSGEQILSSPGTRLAVLEPNDYSMVLSSELVEPVEEAHARGESVIVEVEVKSGHMYAVRIVRTFLAGYDSYVGTMADEDVYGRVKPYTKIGLYEQTLVRPEPRGFFGAFKDKMQLKAKIISGSRTGETKKLPAGELKETALTREREFVTGPGRGIQASLPDKESLEEAYRNGQSVAADITIKAEGVNPKRNHMSFSDDDENDDLAYKVSGKTLTRMNENGVVELVQAELKCSCSTYRTKYDCEHVRIAKHDIPLMHQGELTPPSIPGITDETLDKMASARPSSYSICLDEQGKGYIKVEHQHSAWNTRREFTPHVDNVSMTNSKMSAILEHEGELTQEERSFIYDTYITAFAIERTDVSVFYPQANREHLAALRTSDVEIPVAYGYDSEAVNGVVRYGAGSTPENPIIVSRSLKCDCLDYINDYYCEHISLTLNSLGQAIKPKVTLEELKDPRNNQGPLKHSYSEILNRFPDVIKAEEQKQGFMNRYDVDAAEAQKHYDEMEAKRLAAQEEAYRKIEEQRVIYNGYRESRAAAWETSDTGFADDIEAFKDENAKVKARRRKGTEVLDFQTENVTDGICAPGENTRSFGIELEFDIKEGVNQGKALKRIGKELYAAGLTAGPDQEHYHAASGEWSRWSFEEDSTVDGEIVSPIMKDTPEHWAQLKQVCDIINRNGGRASLSAGSHVNISSGSYAYSSAKHANLQRTMKENRDNLFRMASNPHRGSHRGDEWCDPNLSIHNKDIEPKTMGYHAGADGVHSSMVNFQSSLAGYEEDPDARKSRIEYRLWDGTLDPAVIQQQVAISAALTDLAEREIDSNNGYYRAQGSSNAEEDSDMKAAKLLDKLFRKAEDRRRAANLFAITNPV